MKRMTAVAVAIMNIMNMSALTVCILSVSVNGGVSPALMSLISSIAMIGAAAGVTWGGSSTRYSSVVVARTII